MTQLFLSGMFTVQRVIACRKCHKLALSSHQTGDPQ